MTSEQKIKVLDQVQMLSRVNNTLIKIAKELPLRESQLIIKIIEANLLTCEMINTIGTIEPLKQTA